MKTSKLVWLEGSMKSHNSQSLRALMACVSLLAAAQIANASLIGSFSHTYGAVEIDLSVFNGQPGGRYLWEYTVHNNGYGAASGQNGFSGFELYLPTGIPEIGDITPNEPDWEIDGFSGHPVEWDRVSGLGILPGESGIFSFTTDPRAIATNDDGWYHTWQGGVQTDIVSTPGMHVPWVPGLTPVPDTGSSLLLLSIGCIGLGTIGFKDRREA
jgi:hypothetical protein